MELKPLNYELIQDLEDNRYKRIKALATDDAKAYEINHRQLAGAVDNSTYNKELEDLFIR